MPTQAGNSSGIIRTYLVIVGLYTFSASLIWGVHSLFLLHAGLSIQEMFGAHAAFTGSVALFEIPTGVLANTRGRQPRRRQTPADCDYEGGPEACHR